MSYIPTYVFKTVYDIDFNKLYDEGKRIILFDIDNTLLSYKELTPHTKLIELNKKLLDMGFKIYLVSNNNGQRIEMIKEKFLISGFIAKAKKPNPNKMKQFLEKNGFDLNTVIGVGDQILTDILAFNRLKIDSVLVKSIDRSTEHWYTKVNRMREARILRKIAKIDSEKYKEMINLYHEVKDE